MSRNNGRKDVFSKPASQPCCVRLRTYADVYKDTAGIKLGASAPYMKVLPPKR